MSLFLLFASTVTDVHARSVERGKSSGVYLNETAFGSGLIRGEMQGEQEALALYPAFVRLGFNIDALAGIEGGRSTLQLAVEPFVNTIAHPVAGVEAGCGIGLRYLYNISRPVDLFMEGSVAPMFLSIRSVEQGNAGFNFLLQTGAGFQYKITRRTAFFAGYRFRHLSHGGVSGRSNRGINSDALVAGISWLH